MQWGWGLGSPCSGLLCGALRPLGKPLSIQADASASQIKPDSFLISRSIDLYTSLCLVPDLPLGLHASRSLGWTVASLQASRPSSWFYTPWPPCVLRALFGLEISLWSEGFKAFCLPSCLPPCSSSLQASRPALHVACRCLSLGTDGEESSEAWQKFVRDGPAADARVSASVPRRGGTHTTSPQRAHPRGAGRTGRAARAGEAGPHSTGGLRRAPGRPAPGSVAAPHPSRSPATAPAPSRSPQRGLAAPRPAPLTLDPAGPSRCRGDAPLP